MVAHLPHQDNQPFGRLQPTLSLLANALADPSGLSFSPWTVELWYPHPRTASPHLRITDPQGHYVEHDGSWTVQDTDLLVRQATQRLLHPSPWSPS